ncbi:TadA family conjugal transfer-associated ATPase [Gordonia neofelifaecis]|uniref:Type II secretion system protein E n=1 Tax=Gordonia neofelifaecis NRRL B-59395 TaxID=644548 RepID=F1YJY5_9ACTN|nr:TadA family conjugal transfer-associated ATPase [Gordonia neofelifaecis]EGD55067.1 type II secretion system protein E [Gordonia neofelifaecis NRRL B-59395]
MTGVDADLLERVRRRLAVEAGAGTASPGPAVIADAIRAESAGLLGDTDLLAALRYLQTEMVGVGRLEVLLADPEVTDVLVVGPRVWADRGDGPELTDVTFDDEASVRRLAARLALGAGRRLDDAQPWVDGRLAGVGRNAAQVRLHAVIPPLAPDGTCISLRVLRSATHDYRALVDSGSIAAEVSRLVADVIAARLAFLVVGGTGAGKTTVLGSLLGLAEPTQRILCVEDAPELDPRHPHVVRLVARAANVEGVGEVTVRMLVRQALRMRPDRIVVGEVRGAEVIDLLTALNTGHEGCAGTLHANSIAEVPARMEALAALGGMGRTALHSQLGPAIQVILGVARTAGGQRRLAEIGVVERDDSGLVRVVPAWCADGGFTDRRASLERLVGRRS